MLVIWGTIPLPHHRAIPLAFRFIRSILPRNRLASELVSEEIWCSEWFETLFFMSNATGLPCASTYMQPLPSDAFAGDGGSRTRRLWKKDSLERLAAERSTTSRSFGQLLLESVKSPWTGRKCTSPQTDPPFSISVGPCAETTS